MPDEMEEKIKRTYAPDNDFRHLMLAEEIKSDSVRYSKALDYGEEQLAKLKLVLRKE